MAEDEKDIEKRGKIIEIMRGKEGAISFDKRTSSGLEQRTGAQRRKKRKGREKKNEKRRK